MSEQGQELKHAKGYACDSHGDQRAAYVCQHLKAGVEDGQDRGVVWGRDEEKNVNAWCDACDTVLLENDGEWTDAVVEAVGLTVICEQCFDSVKGSSTVRELE